LNVTKCNGIEHGLKCINICEREREIIIHKKKKNLVDWVRAQTKPNAKKVISSKDWIGIVFSQGLSRMWENSESTAEM
jgi:hypothetical protein